MGRNEPDRSIAWQFRKAPAEYQDLFSEGSASDWLVYVPEEMQSAIEPELVRWRPVYPVSMRVLADRGLVYHGSPGEALKTMTAGLGTESVAPVERRTMPRVRFDQASRYVTFGPERRSGFGHTTDLSGSGIAFTTSEALTPGVRLRLAVEWPIRLAESIPVRLLADGNVVRVSGLAAAMQLSHVNFETITGITSHPETIHGSV